MTELISTAKHYWWLVLGIAGFIAWIVSVILKVRELNQKDDELYLKESNASLLKTTGVIGAAVFLLNHFNKNEDDPK